MTWAIDQKLHWTDHYAEYGFAVIKNTLDPKFIDAALAEIREMFGHQNLPLNQWTTKNTPLGLRLRVSPSTPPSSCTGIVAFTRSNSRPDPRIGCSPFFGRVGWISA